MSDEREHAAGPSSHDPGAAGARAAGHTPSYDPAAEVVDLCRDLIRIDTTNTGDDSGPGERKAAEHVAALLQEVGIEVTLTESEPGRTSLLAHWGGDADGTGPTGTRSCCTGTWTSSRRTRPTGPWTRSPARSATATCGVAGPST